MGLLNIVKSVVASVPVVGSAVSGIKKGLSALAAIPFVGAIATIGLIGTMALMPGLSGLLRIIGTVALGKMIVGAKSSLFNFSDLKPEVIASKFWDSTPWQDWEHFKRDAASDAQGRSILWHWLYGGGKDFIKDNDKSWAKYMTDNELLLPQVREIINGYMSQVENGGSMTFNEKMAMEIENGEQIIGYQYLHGANMDVGGFNISGTIAKNENGAATVSMTYQWNDIIDPNFFYDTDSAKAKFANSIPFANPTDYTIRISWADVSTTDESGNYSTGWLADDWKYAKNPDHNNVSPPPMPTPIPTPTPTPTPAPTPAPNPAPPTNPPERE